MLEILQTTDFKEFHTRCFACYRPDSSKAFCEEPRCNHCWKGKDKRRNFIHRDFDCTNISDGPHAEGIGGHPTIRCGPVKDVTRVGGVSWMLTTPPYGASIELYSIPGAWRSKTPGPAGSCTLGRVTYFFKHRGKPARSSDNGVETLLGAVAEYVTNVVGQERESDPATGLAVMRLKKR